MHSGFSALHIRSFADKYPRLIFQNTDKFESLRNLQGEVLPPCYLSGLDTRNTDALMGGAFSHFGVSFYPQALTVFFGIQSTELVNTMPAIEMICRTNLPAKLARAGSHAERVEILCTFFYDRLTKSKTVDPLIDAVFHEQAIAVTTDLPALEKKYNYSLRQIQRRFKASVGISPKKYQRILRFEFTLQLLKNARYSDLTSIAYDAGYTDQSHFIKDFTDFAGMTPYSFARQAALGSESSSFIYGIR